MIFCYWLNRLNHIENIVKSILYVYNMYFTPKNNVTVIVEHPKSKKGEFLKFLKCKQRHVIWPPRIFSGIFVHKIWFGVENSSSKLVLRPFGRCLEIVGTPLKTIKKYFPQIIDTNYVYDCFNSPFTRKGVFVEGTFWID